MRQERFEFESGREPMMGVLHLRVGGVAIAAATTGRPTSVEEQAAGTHSGARGGLGVVALAFDHRYFGESGGRPRRFESGGQIAFYDDPALIAPAADAIARFFAAALGSAGSVA